MTQIDWDTVQQWVVATLQDLVRFESVNPPGNEMPCVAYIRYRLAQAGIAATVLESKPGRANLIARLPSDGTARPLLLLSHVDVVPAEPAHWVHPPFSGAIEGGFIWGRGTLDMKGMTAAELEVFLLVKRLGLPLKRDIILAATADEEAGGEHGLGWLVDHHFRLLDAEFALNEGGGFGSQTDAGWLFTCQTAEKGGCWIKVRTHGRPGHGSMPRGPSAVTELVAALNRLANASMSTRHVPTVVAYVHALSHVLPEPLKEAVLGVLDPATEAASLAVLPDEHLATLLRASLHNTAVPTVLRAGQKVNVIPSVAEAEVDCRVLPGQTIEDALAEIRAVLGPAVEIEVIKAWPGTESSADTELFHTIQNVMGELEPGSAVVPYMSTGATDSRYLAAKGVRVYGFFPSRALPGEPHFSELIHAHDERASLDNLLFGTRALFEIVSRTCC